MFRVKNYPDSVILASPGVGDVTPIDQYDAQDFNKNEAGWTRNDISQLARAQSMKEYEMLSARLVEQPVGNSIPDDVSLDDALASIRPRWCQSPNELQVFAELTNEPAMRALEKFKKLKETSDIPSSAPEVESKTD